jgi:Biopolymer transport protein
MEDKEFSSINVIPLVDIMLVLLTIVLITATFVVQGSIPVQLPQAKASHEENLKGLFITITQEGKIFFENRMVSLLELERELEKYQRDSQVQVMADRRATVQSLVDVLTFSKGLALKRFP